MELNEQKLADLEQRFTGLEEENKGLKKRIADLDDRIDDLEEENTTLKASLAAKAPAGKKADAPKNKKLEDHDLVTYKGKKYKWGFASFPVPGYDGRIKAVEAATDEKIIAAILKVPGQSILIEQL